jgi:hypothetical protein
MYSRRAQSYSLTACSNLAFLDSINFLTAAGDNGDGAPYALGSLNETMQDRMKKAIERSSYRETPCALLSANSRTRTWPC